MINVVSYRRVSTEKQVIEGEGLDIQLDRIKAFCKQNGYNLILDENTDFVDEGISGAKETVDRPGIMNLLAYCKEHSIQYVVIDKVDRLSRELFQQLFIEKQLLVYGTEIIFSAQETLNSTSETDKAMITLMRQMMGAFAEFERTLINQRLTDGKNKKAHKGDKPAGRQPFGYSYANDRKATVINEAEAKIVRAMYNYRARGFSLEQIAMYFNTVITDEQRDGFNVVNRNRKWSHRSVHAILTNDYYLGRITHNGKKIEGNHEPIVDLVTWNKANCKAMRGKVA
ncbi:MAG: recombinase family protein [Defluviitaleaceae bacterium]|nr:recombinase family protein [Defluviitaleaceae bacterium]